MYGIKLIIWDMRIGGICCFTFVGKSSLKQEEYVLYKTEEISYKRRKYLGCKSENFLPEGWQLITLERLFMDFIMKVFIKIIHDSRTFGKTGIYSRSDGTHYGN